MLHWSQLNGFSPVEQEKKNLSIIVIFAYDKYKTKVNRLTTVDFFMALQQILLYEAHITLTAPKRPLTCTKLTNFSTLLLFTKTSHECCLRLNLKRVVQLAVKAAHLCE